MLNIKDQRVFVHVMKACGGEEVLLHAFLISALHGEERTNSNPRHRTSRDRVPCTYWRGEGVGAAARLDDLEKKYVVLLSGIELRFLGLQSLA